MTWARRCRSRYRAIFCWHSMSLGGQCPAENGVVKLRWRPASIACSRAIVAARSESSMKTIALTEETPPRRTQSRVRSVVLLIPSPIVGINDKQTGLRRNTHSLNGPPARADRSRHSTLDNGAQVLRGLDPGPVFAFIGPHRPITLTNLCALL